MRGGMPEEVPSLEALFLGDCNGMGTQWYTWPANEWARTIFLFVPRYDAAVASRNLAAVG